MTATVLVTGSAERVAAVSAALQAAGARVLSASSPDLLADEVGRLPPDSLSCYVQLPVALTPRGADVVSRVRSFLDQGLLTRFRLAETVLPALARDGRVILVAGHTPMQAQVPDDEAARIALLHVLAHAIRADTAPANVRVRVVVAGHDVDEIVTLALAADVGGSAPGAATRTEPALHGEQMSYADWRTEVLGLATIEF
jgi:hypothetical protein